MGGNVAQAKMVVADDSGTSLLGVLRRGDSDAAKAVLEERQFISGRDAYGNTRLMFAAHWGLFDVVERLVKDGEDVNAVNNHGDTVLRWAVDGAPSENNVKTVRFLIENGAEVHTKGDNDTTMLEHARYIGRADLLDILTGWDTIESIEKADHIILR